MGFTHTPVMMAETIAHLNCRPGGIYVDGTLGGAGHARRILSGIMPGGLLIGIDQDMDAVANARLALAEYGDGVRLFHDSFTALPQILNGLGIASVDGILLDLGLSLHQIRESGRGFSFMADEPLDMRMNAAGDQTAADIINGADPGELRRIFSEYGEERHAGRIARRIAMAREKTPIRTARQLAELVRDAAPGGGRERIHPATRVFMALRIAVNRELERLRTFMDEVMAENGASVLAQGGRICVLAFHSLEDRIVKHSLRALAAGCDCPPRIPRCVCGKRPVLRLLTRKALTPTAAEIQNNPMARSTRLRAAEKIG